MITISVWWLLGMCFASGLVAFAFGALSELLRQDRRDPAVRPRVKIRRVTMPPAGPFPADPGSLLLWSDLAAAGQALERDVTGMIAATDHWVTGAEHIIPHRTRQYGG